MEPASEPTMFSVLKVLIQWSLQQPSKADSSLMLFLWGNWGTKQCRWSPWVREATYSDLRIPHNQTVWVSRKERCHGRHQSPTRGWCQDSCGPGTRTSLGDHGEEERPDSAGCENDEWPSSLACLWKTLCGADTGLTKTVWRHTQNTQLTKSSVLGS